MAKQQDAAPSLLGGDASMFSLLPEQLKEAFANYLQAEIEEKIEGKRKEAERRKRLNYQRVELARQEVQAKKLKWRQCSHMKEKNAGAAIGGQRIGTGQLCFICQRCFRSWYNPAIGDEQEACPITLLSYLSMDDIGG
jgi:hypothetical protein